MDLWAIFICWLEVKMIKCKEASDTCSFSKWLHNSKSKYEFQPRNVVMCILVICNQPGNSNTKLYNVNLFFYLFSSTMLLKQQSKAANGHSLQLYGFHWLHIFITLNIWLFSIWNSATKSMSDLEFIIFINFIMAFLSDLETVISSMEVMVKIVLLP